MKESGSILILFLAGIVIASVAIIGGSLYYKQNLQQQKLSTPNPLPTAAENQKEDAVITNPQKVVDQFLKAIQNKDRKTAKMFLSPNVNQDALKSTVDESYNFPSLYTMNFTYQILNSRYDSTNTKAYVDTNVIANNENLPTKFFLEKNNANSWLIINSETVSQNASSPFREATRSAHFNTVLLIVDGQADFLLTSPEKKSAGYSTASKTSINEIADVLYTQTAFIRIATVKTFSITDLIGTWELRVIGQKQGKYFVRTELVDNTNHQTSETEGNITSGETKTYLLKYPDEKGKPLEITLLK